MGYFDNFTGIIQGITTHFQQLHTTFGEILFDKGLVIFAIVRIQQMTARGVGFSTAQSHNAAHRTNVGAAHIDFPIVSVKEVTQLVQQQVVAANNNQGVIQLAWAGICWICCCTLVWAASGSVLGMSLNRQLLSEMSQLGLNKPRVAALRGCRVNPDVMVEIVDTHMNRDNVFDLLHQCDAVLDALDNIESRNILSSASVQAALCIKLLVGRPVETGKLSYFDLLNQEFETIPMV